ncbi:MAG TPA: S9 family peptidase, partial [Janthinobacterium sp.]|nr:S9 family peptidase [Janthinobacterium sp.]
MHLSRHPYAALTLLAASIAFAPAQAAAENAAPHTITHADVWLMKRLGAPMPSPDGKWAVFSVVDSAYDSGDQWSDLWIKSLTDDTPPRRLTFSKGGESGVNWSPDSRKLVFSSKREGDDSGQLYLLDIAGGGDAQRLTSLTLGARQPQWSPDGKQLLFISEIFPGNSSEEDVKKSAKERKDRKFNARVYEQFPVRYFDKWLDDKQVRLFVMEAKPDAPARNLLAGSKLAALPGFGGGESDDGQVLDAVWAPDSQSVLFSAANNREESARASHPEQLYSVALAGGEPRQLTRDQHSYRHPKFSADG